MTSTSCVLTVLSVDLTGFSLVAERQSPLEAFAGFKRLREGLLALVAEHQGLIHHLSSDGMLASFGYSQTVASHRAQADQALRCAMAIQRKSVDGDLAVLGPEKLGYPFRMGIHSGYFYIGDIGNESAPQWVLLGHGINLAQILENACDTYGILLSAATLDMLQAPELKKLFLHRRFLQMRNIMEPIETYECDLFYRDLERKHKADQAYRQMHGLFRRDNRWPVPENMAIHATSEHGKGKLLNFSTSGLAVSFDKFLIQGTLLHVVLETEPARLRQRLMDRFLSPVVCEVRWGRAAEGGQFTLGLAIRNLTPEQKSLLVKELRAAITLRPVVAQTAS